MSELQDLFDDSGESTQSQASWSSGRRKRGLTTSWTKTQASKLVFLIEPEEWLWNTFHPGYKNFKSKRLVWDKIAEQVQHGTEDCIIKWSSLRSNFKARHMGKTKSGGEEEDVPEPYCYMGFLIDIIQKKKLLCVSSSAKKATDPSSISALNDETTVEEIFEVPETPPEIVCEVLPSSLSSPSISPKCRRLEIANRTQTSAEQKTTVLGAAFECMMKPNDEWDTITRTVAEHMRNAVNEFPHLADRFRIKLVEVSLGVQNSLLLNRFAPQGIPVNVQQLATSTVKTERKNVYVTRPDVDESGLKLLRDKCNVTTWTKSLPVPRKELLQQIVGKDALYCTLTDKIDAELINHAGPQLKCISTNSVSSEHIDLEECKKRGIRVGYTPDVPTDETAELTLGLLLATNRRLLKANPPTWICGQGLKGTRVGLFGFGRIGQEIAARILPFKPSKITYTTRTESPEEASKLQAAYVSFDEMLRESDFIIVCCPLTPSTKEIFNKAAFEKMKPNCIFINTARGGIVDQQALYAALKERRIRAAGLDVTTPEPLPLDHPLLKLDNVVILPHIGSTDIETRKEMSRITAQNIIAGLEGKQMIAEVTL